MGVAPKQNKTIKINSSVREVTISVKMHILHQQMPAESMAPDGDDWMCLWRPLVPQE